MIEARLFQLLSRLRISAAVSGERPSWFEEPTPKFRVERDVEHNVDDMFALHEIRVVAVKVLNLISIIGFLRKLQRSKKRRCIFEMAASDDSQCLGAQNC